jgi:hypothetical protein
LSAHFALDLCAHDSGQSDRFGHGTVRWKRRRARGTTDNDRDMGYGLTNHLLGFCGGIFVACLFIAWRRLPLWSAVTIAFVRVFIPLLYFAWYYDGTWTFVDGVEYIDHGETLLDQGFSPLSILSRESRDTVHSMAGSEHILYDWWNLTTMWFFGVYYYVPVLINVLITFCSAHLLAQLLEELHFPASYQRTLQAFYLLHWDIIAWSSVLNLKDIVVQLMTIGFFLCSVRAVRRRSLQDALVCMMLIAGFQYLRFYVPFIIGASAATWMFLEWRDFRKYPLLAGGLVVGIWLLPARGYQLLESFSPFEICYGIGRFVLTPQPWDVEAEKSFLFLPATLHWLMILPATAGGLMLWLESRVTRVILVYTAILIVLYALAEEIQGPRQRLQLSFVFAWAQMHFLWRWTHAPASNVASPPAGARLRKPVRQVAISPPRRPAARTSA